MFRILLVLMGFASLNASLGINFEETSDWATELPFSNVFHQARPWISHRNSWADGPVLDLDEKGYPKKIETGCSVETLVLTKSKGHIPKGNFTFLYDGEGVIEFPRSNIKIVQKSPGKFILNLEQLTDSLFIKITKTNPDNYIRNIRLYLPGYDKETFNEEFVARWKDFKVFRFMTWQFINDSQVESWNDRPKKDKAFYSEKGVPLEIMVDLCNNLNVNPWFCIPHKADDNYIRQMAIQLRDSVNPNLKIYLEYSNEVWNTQFKQYSYAVDKAKELSLGSPERPWEGGALFYGLRSKQIFQIFEEVFAGSDRLVRILAWQAEADINYWMENLLLKPNQVADHIDAIAIAPYFSCNVSPHSNPTESVVEKWSIEQLFSHLENRSLPQTIQSMKQQKKLCDKYGLTLLCYEAGQHLVGIQGSENNNVITGLFFQANKDPRMGALYTKYLNAWKAAGGEVMCLFSSTGMWSKWGCWGLTEFPDETENDQPKYKAVMEWQRCQESY